MDGLDGQNVVEKQRFDSYKLGQPSALKSNGPSRSSHGRSHSRNLSISTSISAPSFSAFSLNSPVTSTSMQDLFSTAGPSKRNSHHRRRSSVSTRRESSEVITGIVLPEPPPSEEPDKDMVRRNALWALEGRPEPSFAKVQIPELSTPVLEKMLYDFSSKPSFPLRNTQKRDSYKIMSSSSCKDQLHTLVEEEEGPCEPPSPTQDKSSNPRARPATLSLRPLSLTPNSLTTSGQLPTPTLTPRSSGVNPSTNPVRRQSLATLSCNTESTTAEKRSSISYKRSQTLPTPDATPTGSVRSSLGSSNAGGSVSSGSEEETLASHRPLSASEQHFLFKSHNALLARITDLEHALKTTTRPQSMQSFPSYGRSESSDEPSDEMMRLLVDLKAERDELTRDVDGWRDRVEGLENQLGQLTGRVEAERREAWVARSQANLLLAEKNVLVKQVEDAVQTELGLRTELADMGFKVEQGRSAEEECERLRVQLQELDAARLFATPAPSYVSTERNDMGFGFSSPDGEADDETAPFNFGVETTPFNFGDEVLSDVEEDEGEADEEDCLAGYEDEKEEDVDCQSQGSSASSLSDFQSRQSFSNFRFGASAPPKLSFAATPSFSPSPSTSATPTTATQATHPKRASLLEAWSFPNGQHSAPATVRTPEEVDRFFGCLEDLDTSPLINERQNSFAFGGNLDDDGDLPPFLLPCDVGVIESPVLDALSAEEEPESNVKITLSAPELAQTDLLNKRKPASFVFGSPSPQVAASKIKRTASPSLIPRPMLSSSRPPLSTPPRAPSTPPKRGTTSLLPQPKSTPTRPKALSPSPVLLRQPERKPVPNADAQSPPSSSAFSSMIGSPLASRWFGSVVPSLWSTALEDVEAPTRSPVVRERRFIDREVQLARLKAHLGEGRITSMLDICTACDGGLVSL